MMREAMHIGRWSMIPNGVPLENYDFNPTVANDAPLAFLGRLEEIKGPHLAIEIARRAGAPLILAGNVPKAHRAWFRSHVEPQIDGDRIRYIGPVDDAQKNALLGAARALLMPILWEEPFGIVMAEAMACGAPVLGLNRGAVPEVVEDGVTGFVRQDVDGLIEAVGQISEIDRPACRARVEAFYSDQAVVESYISLYRTMI
jgi:glycosyltransferase involved in cell wall biosynthesis